MMPCQSHARSQFHDVRYATVSPIALEALQRIAALLAIEGDIAGQAPERRAAARQEHAQPLLDQVKAFLDISLSQRLPSTAMRISATVATTHQEMPHRLRRRASSGG